MEKFIPVNKKSKKVQKEYYSKKRNTWGEFNPMTRTMSNGKGYNCEKLKQEDRRNGSFSQKIERLPFLVVRIFALPFVVE